MAKSKRKSRLRICKRCKKREWTTSKSELCRHCYLYKLNKKKRKEWVKNKCCASCGKKVKPKIIIQYRCESCLDKLRKKKNEKM